MREGGAPKSLVWWLCLLRECALRGILSWLDQVGLSSSLFPSVGPFLSFICQGMGQLQSRRRKKDEIYGMGGRAPFY